MARDLNDIIKNILTKNIQLLNHIDKTICHFRTQNYDAALRTATIVITQISSLIDSLLPRAEYFNYNYQLVDSESITRMLGGLLDAQQNKDYILLADLYEIQLTPFLINLQEVIIGKEVMDFDEDYYIDNVEAIEQTEPELSSYLNSLESPINLLEKGYSIEYTSCGLKTLALDDNNIKYYMHSNNRVLNESFTLAQSWYSEEKSEYIIYGLGLGYHVKELFELDDYISIEVYESDINVIQLACAFSDMKSIVANPNIKLVYDPEYTKLINKISNMNIEAEFIIHYPSLRNIKDTAMKEKLENYFIQFSSVKNQLHFLNGNFKENILHYNGIVDELGASFSGKDLYIIAAGPSLDKNFMQLKEVGVNAIILATGTVYRKVLDAGIIPDYVIVTDPNPRVYAQISGLESKKVPMLFLSTAYKGFTANYQGDKYLICQKDFPKAEDFAKEKGINLYKTGGSVSTTALDIGIMLGSRRIIFLGLDLAFTDNFVHAAGTSRRELDNTQDLRQIEDIYGKMIYTSRNLGIYKKWMENRIKDVKGIEFIDATEGGAKIQGMRIANLKDIIKVK